MNILGGIVAGILGALGLLHVYWAAGGRLGGAAAVPTVAGRRVFEPSLGATLAVAVALLLASFILLGQIQLVGGGLPRWLFQAGTSGLAVVFGLRVVGNFRSFGLFKTLQGTPFAHWDTWLYSPLAAFIAIACCRLVIPTQR